MNKSQSSKVSWPNPSQLYSFNIQFSVCHNHTCIQFTKVSSTYRHVVSKFKLITIGYCLFRGRTRPVPTGAAILTNTCLRAKFLSISSRISWDCRLGQGSAIEVQNNTLHKQCFFSPHKLFQKLCSHLINLFPNSSYIYWSLKC